jgi:hypothetical protein
MQRLFLPIFLLIVTLLSPFAYADKDEDISKALDAAIQRYEAAEEARWSHPEQTLISLHHRMGGGRDALLIDSVASNDSPYGNPRTVNDDGEWSRVSRYDKGIILFHLNVCPNPLRIVYNPSKIPTLACDRGVDLFEYLRENFAKLKAENSPHVQNLEEAKLFRMKVLSGSLHKQYETMILDDAPHQLRPESIHAMLEHLADLIHTKKVELPLHFELEIVEGDRQTFSSIFNRIPNLIRAVEAFRSPRVHTLINDRERSLLEERAFAEVRAMVFELNKIGKLKSFKTAYPEYTRFFRSFLLNRCSSFVTNDKIGKEILPLMQLLQ